MVSSYVHNIGVSAAKLVWADGRVSFLDVDPTVTEVVFRTKDGRNHYFRPTEEIDDDGRDIYKEVQPEA